MWVKDGIKFVYLTGNSPYEIGFEHGRLLKNDIEEMIEGIKKFAEKEYGKILDDIAIKILFHYSNSLKKGFSDDLIEEMKGIADSSGQNLEWIILANSIYEIAVRFYNFLKLDACSFFVAPWKNSDYTVIGKTTDLADHPFLSNLLSRHRLVFVYDCKWMGNKYITFSFHNYICCCRHIG